MSEVVGKMVYDYINVTIPSKQEVSLNFTKPIWLIEISTNSCVMSYMDKLYTDRVVLVNSKDWQIDVSILVLKQPETEIKVEVKTRGRN